MRELLDWEKAQIADAYQVMRNFTEPVIGLLLWILGVAIYLALGCGAVLFLLWIVLSN